MSGGAFGLLGVPFAAFGPYFIFGRFIYKANRRRPTADAVTNRRVLEIVRGRNGESFDGLEAMSGGYRNTGMEFLGRGSPAGGVAFYDIEEPARVAQLVERLREADLGD